MADVVDALLEEYRFGGIEAIAAILDLPGAARHRVEQLAHAGDRLLELDAEDFAQLAADGHLPATVVERVRAAQFPRDPAAADRGSLASLVPLHELMLEALAVRWLRREPTHVVVLMHLLAEYLPLLAWESVLGHAGDPMRLTAFVEVEGSRWGQRDRCDHTRAHRSGAVRVAGAARGDAATWSVYLDHYHSRVSEALARCAARPGGGRPAVAGTCRRPCTVWTQLPAATRDELGARVHLARMFADSPVVELRHHAPVGHFFGVPSPEEILDAWERTWRRLARRWADGANPLTGNHRRRRRDNPEPLLGLSMLVSVIAGRPVRAGSVLRTIRDEINTELAPMVPDHRQPGG